MGYEKSAIVTNIPQLLTQFHSKECRVALIGFLGFNVSLDGWENPVPKSPVGLLCEPIVDCLDSSGYI